MSFAINPKDLALYDVPNEQWVAESVTYVVSIGASSKNIKQTAKFTLNKETVVEKDERVLAPQVAISELKSK